MKKLMILLVLVMFFVASPTAAQTRGVTISFEWEQTGVDEPDFWGWKLWSSTTAGGPYDLVFELPYGGDPLAVYSGEGEITAPDQAETTYFFVVNAWDDVGNPSGYSNEVSHLVDLLGPDDPVLRVTGTVTIKPPQQGGGDESVM